MALGSGPGFPYPPGPGRRGQGGAVVGADLGPARRPAAAGPVTHRVPAVPSRGRSPVTALSAGRGEAEPASSLHVPRAES